MTSFAQMHNDWLDPDRHGLNDEQPIDLTEDKTIKGYGRRQHGLNGKDADLDYGGQNKVNAAWWREDGTIEIEGVRYASIVPSDEWNEEQHTLAQEIIFDVPYSGEWDGDYWVFSDPYSLRFASDAEDVDAACAAAYEAICKDSSRFEACMTELAKELERIKP